MQMQKQLISCSNTYGSIPTRHYHDRNSETLLNINYYIINENSDPLTQLPQKDYIPPIAIHYTINFRLKCAITANVSLPMPKAHQLLRRVEQDQTIKSPITTPGF